MSQELAWWCCMDTAYFSNVYFGEEVAIHSVRPCSLSEQYVLLNSDEVI